MPSKYDRLTRSQIMLTIRSVEDLLPSVKYGSARDTKLRRERLELFAELQKRDDALIQRWNNNQAYGYFERD
jgi:hypothetical protein